MKIDCPHCGRDIPADDINIQSAIAKCTKCGAVFGFGELVSGFQGYAKPTVDKPRSFTVTQEGADYVIVRRWFSWKFVALLFFVLFWDGFLVVWYFTAFTKGGPLIMKLFPILHVSVGVALTYWVITGFVNRTTFRLGSAEVSIRHWPLPWPGNRVLPRSEVEQFFCEEKVSHSRNGTSRTYHVSLVMRGGNRLKLVTGLDSPQEALFLEQEIEKVLGLKDRPVAGEMRPA